MVADVRPLRDREARCDLAAERAVLAACLIDSRRLGETGLLEPEAFFSESHRWIFRAIRALASEGRAVDIVTVATLLHDWRRLDQVGGSPYLGELTDATPEPAHLGEHARIVRDDAQARRVIEGAEKLAAAGRSGAPLSELRGRLQQLGQVDAEEDSRRVKLLGASEILALLPPVPYLLQALDICPGAPTLFAGLGFSAKTLLAHALALAVACDAPAWGAFPVRPGKAVLLDFEQGQHLSRRRIQRMARGMGLVPEGDALRLASMPGLYLDDATAEAELSALCQGVALLVVDSLSAACPSLEENSASARKVLDALGRVSERTGCVVVVIHHARKPSKDDTGGARNSIRGSGALFDAAGAVVVFERQPDETIVLRHEKARASGRLSESLTATIVDTEDGGLAVRVEESRKPGAQGELDGAGALEAAKQAIVEHLTANGPVASANVLCLRLKGRRQVIYTAAKELTLEGVILRESDASLRLATDQIGGRDDA
jgi:replicative DNA helicase